MSTAWLTPGPSDSSGQSHEELTANHRMLQRDHDALKDRHELIIQQHDDISSELKTLHVEHEKLNEHKYALERKVNELENEKHDLSGRVRDSATHGDLDFVETQLELNNAKDTIEVLNQQVAHLTRDLNEQRDVFQHHLNQFGPIKQNLEAKLLTANHQVESLTEELNRLKAKQETSEKQHAEGLAQVQQAATHAEQNKTLHKQLAEVTAAKNEMEHKMPELTAKANFAATIEKKLHELVVEKTELERKVIAHGTVDVEGLKGKIASQETELKNLQERNINAEVRATALEVKVNMLEQTKHVAMAKVAALEEANVTLTGYSSGPNSPNRGLGHYQNPTSPSGSGTFNEGLLRDQIASLRLKIQKQQDELNMYRSGGSVISNGLGSPRRAPGGTVNSFGQIQSPRSPIGKQLSGSALEKQLTDQLRHSQTQQSQLRTQVSVLTDQKAALQNQVNILKSQVQKNAHHQEALEILSSPRGKGASNPLSLRALSSSPARSFGTFPRQNTQVTLLSQSPERSFESDPKPELHQDFASNNMNMYNPNNNAADWEGKCRQAQDAHEVLQKTVTHLNKNKQFHDQTVSELTKQNQILHTELRVSLVFSSYYYYHSCFFLFPFLLSSFCGVL